MPFMAARCVRMVVLGIRAVVKAIGRFASRGLHRNGEEGQSEPKSARDEKLDEFRKKLVDTFDDEGWVGEVMARVREWSFGQSR